MLLQTESASCGLACLAMIREYHGFAVDLPRLRARFSISMRGMSLRRLMDVAAVLGLKARALSADMVALDRLDLPCILHWRMNHFVVLVRRMGERYVIHDPAVGRRSLTRNQVGAAFTGFAVVFEDHAAPAEVSPRKRVRIADVTGPLAGVRKALALHLGLSVGVQLLALGFPLQLQWTLDSITAGKGSERILALAGAFVAVTLLHAGLRFLRRRLLGAFERSVDRQWFTNAYGRLLRLPHAFFERRQTGDIVSKMDAIDRIRQTVSVEFVEVLLDGLFCIVAVCAMAFYSVPMAACTATAGLAYAAVRMALRRRTLDAGAECSATLDRQNAYLSESVHGMRSIKLFSREQGWLARWCEMLDERISSQASLNAAASWDEAAAVLLGQLLRVLLVAWGAMATLHKGLTVGGMLACLGYMELFYPRCTATINRVFDLMMMRIQLDRLADIMTHPEEDTAEAVASLPATSADIVATGLGCRYGADDPWVLRGASLTLHAGRTTIICGPSGAGKSTLVKLILGFLQPDEGVIHVGGIPLGRLAPHVRRSLFGTVLQGDQLFGGTILQNVSMFEEEPDIDFARRCLELAAILGEIDAMPMGVHTPVAENGDGLSGGQQQRLMIARALYKRPRFVILDEGTSQVDLDMERRIVRAIRRTGCGLVLISHRDLAQYDDLAGVVRVDAQGVRQTAGTMEPA
jgi:ATP-binding cassette subfamily B protein RaxB